MPAHHYIDNDARLIITTWEGDAVNPHFIDALTNYQENFQTNPDYQEFNELVNFNKLAKVKLSTADIRHLSKLASKTDTSERKRKLAFVVSSNLVFGFIRMYETYRSFIKSSNKEIQVFKKEKDAFEWLTKEN